MPPDRAILEELKEIAESEDPIPTKQMNKLLLAGMLSISQSIETLRTTQESCAKMITDALKPIKKNPMVAVGDFIIAHPKTTLMLSIGFLVLSNIWFIDEVRYMVLVWLKVPEAIIKLLVH